jgi:16S rRNA (guanine527-N7)-methyltransferase
VDTAAIAHLLRPFAELEEAHLASISIYIDLLLKWNARINLTAVRDPEEMVTRHFGESIFAARVLMPAGSERQATEGRARQAAVIDFGSGAGFPGLPFAMLVPAAQVTLIESNQKKAAFLNEVISALDLQNAKVFSRRAEEYPDRADLVMMRAVERLENALAAAIGLVAEHGRVALMIGIAQAIQVRALAPDVDWEEPVAVPGGHSRILLAGTRRVISTRAVKVE